MLIKFSFTLKNNLMEILSLIYTILMEVSTDDVEDKPQLAISMSIIMTQQFFAQR